VNEFFLGVHNPTLLQIPTLVLHGFKAIGTEEAIMLNLPTEPYRYDAPDEFRVDPHGDDVPYNWALKEK
jgi:dTDP-4-dehydrorhamnose 3,5-epimerase